MVAGEWIGWWLGVGWVTVHWQLATSCLVACLGLETGSWGLVVVGSWARAWLAWWVEAGLGWAGLGWAGWLVGCLAGWLAGLGLG